ncbi:MAG: hypothetical protein IT448_00335 [Phycisphaerales bacterium]|nr:hypothetical protein [Phycisphaerales bacterium]
MSSRTDLVRQWFGVGQLQAAPMIPVDSTLPKIEAGQIVLITGASGSGKTTLLRRITDQWPGEVVDIDRIEFPAGAAVDCFGSMPLEQVLEILGRCGLGEVWTYLSPAGRLSQGQQWRLRLAMALGQGRMNRPAKLAETGKVQLLVSDEFAAILDRVTACVVGRMLRKMFNGQQPVAMVCCTSQDDLAGALKPDITITCDFGQLQIVGR